MSDNPAVEKLAKLIKGIHFAMLATTDEFGEIHGRPMATQQADFDGTLWFLTGISTHKVAEIGRDHHVNLSYADPGSNRYVSVSGVARLVRDKQKIKELWNPIYKAWFPEGLDDPELAALQVTPTKAEYWDAPSSKVVQLVGFVKAIVTGQRARGGDHAELNLEGSQSS